MTVERVYDLDSLFDLDPGPWAKDPKTKYWATLDGEIVAIPGYLTVGGRMWHSRGNFWGTRSVWYPPRIVKTSITPKGYKRTPQGSFVHQVVARAWIPNPNDDPQVNHKDGVKINNHPSNLEWVTNRDNVIHAYRLGLQPKRQRDEYGRIKRVN
jgi:hypothetical protein